jgi:hypothetical protein
MGKVGNHCKREVTSLTYSDGLREHPITFAMGFIPTHACLVQSLFSNSSNL